MGLNMGRSLSSYDYTPTRVPPPAPNPNPANFEIVESQLVLGHVILFVRYPDATSYEGKKILFYKDTRLSDLKAQKTLDPHFSNNKAFLSPFARFEPTTEGWDAAVELARAIS